MKRSFIAGFGLLALAAAMPASAADLPRGGMPYKAPAYFAGYNWTGFYLGINGGGAFGDSDGWLSAQHQADRRHDRRHRRLQLARRRQPVGVRPRSRHRLGLHQRQRGLRHRHYLRDQEQLVRHVARPRRLCVRPDHALSDGRPRGRRHEANRTLFASVKNTNAGWTIGAGVEGAIVGNWTVKVEYLYADLGSINCSVFACGVTTGVDLRLNIVRGGINYRF